MRIIFKKDGLTYSIDNPEIIIDLWTKIRSLPYYSQNTLSESNSRDITGQFFFLDNSTSGFSLGSDLRIGNLYYGTENNPIIIYFKEIVSHIVNERP